MNHLIHSHVNYDQIIDETDLFLIPPKATNLKALKIKAKMGKPFWIEKDSNDEAENFNYSTDKPTTKQNYKDPAAEYSSDFQSFRESFYQSLAASIKPQESELQSQRAVNLSSQLPNCKRIFCQDSFKNTCRYFKARVRSSRNKSLNKIDDSQLTDEKLRYSNVRLMKQIAAFRNIERKMNQNLAILETQQTQLNQLREMEAKIFDVEYELHLDKQVENMKEKISSILQAIKMKQQRFKKKNAVQMRIIQKQGKSEPEVSTPLSIAREDYLTKKREQAAYELRNAELSAKVQKYDAIISDLKQKIRLGSVEQLQNRKIFLQFDIAKRKADFESIECEKMTSVSKINQEICSVELSIMRVNNDIKQFQQREQKAATDGKNQVNPEDQAKVVHKFKFSITPKKSVSREKTSQFFHARK